MPRELWDAALFEFMPSPASGLLLVREAGGYASDADGGEFFFDLGAAGFVHGVVLYLLV